MHGTYIHENINVFLFKKFKNRVLFVYNETKFNNKI